MARNESYTIGIDVDLKSSSRGLEHLEQAAKRAQAAIVNLRKDIQNLAGSGAAGKANVLAAAGLSDDSAAKLSANVKAYKDASAAVRALGQSYEKLANVDPSAATKGMVSALNAMQEALRSITPLDARRLEMLQATIPLMSQAARATREQAQAEKALEQAKQAALRTEQTQLSVQNQLTASQRAAARGLETSAYAAQRAASYYGVFSATMAALPALAVKNAATQERAFADVIRTTQESAGALEGLRLQYQQMSTEIPIAFEEMSRIGTLGAQMDVAKDKLDEFSYAVGSFAAITGETADSTALAFGRLQNMLGGNLKESAAGAGDGFAILASQVAELGAKSVSTEKEVLATAQAIATTGTRIGFSQDEVLGYAAALASIKIPPEWARGSFQRLTSKINSVVAEGGEALDRYAQQIGVTAQEFDELWRSDPAKVLQEIYESLAALDSVAQTSALHELGIKATRDVEFVGRLSANYDLLAKAIDDAGEASKNSDFLDNSVAVIADTFEGTIQRMQNSINNLLANSGSSLLLPLKLVAETINRIAQGLDALPTGLKAFVGAVAAVGAVRLAIQGLSLAAVGFLGNIAQTRRELGALGLTGTNSLQNVAQAYRIATGEAVKLQAATRGVAQANLAAGASGAASGLGQMTAAAKGATGAMGLLRGGLGTVMGVFGGPWGLAITAGITALSVLSESMSETSRRSEQFAASLEAVGGRTALWDAIKRDSLEAARGTQTAVTELSTLYDRAGSATDANTDASKLWITTQGEVVTAAQAVANQLETNTLVMGKNTQQVIFDALKQSEAFKDISTKTAQALADQGFSLTELIAKSSGTGGKAAADAYIDAYIETLSVRSRQLNEKIATTFTGANLQGQPDWPEYQAVQDQIAALEALKSSYGDVTAEIEQAAAQSILMGQGFEEGAAAADEAAEALDEVGGNAFDAAENLKDLNNAFHETIDAAFGVTNATAGVYKALDDLATSVAENGSYFGPDSPGGRANLDALNSYLDAVVDLATQQAQEAGLTIEETTQYIAGQVQWAIDDLSSQGYDLSGVQGAIDQTQNILGQTLTGPDVDDSRLTTRLNDMQQKASTAASNIARDLQAAEAFLTRLGGVGRAAAGVLANVRNASGSSGGWGAGLRLGAAVAAARTGAGRGRLPGIGSALGGYRGTPAPSRGGGGGGGGRGGSGGSSPRSSRSSSPRPSRQSQNADREAKKKTKSAAELFEDFLSRLSRAMNKAVEQWWKSTTATDAYHKQLNSMRKSIKDTRDKMEDLRKSNERLTQDIRESQVALADARHFNSIARKYGDALRTQQTQADIDKALLDIQEKRQEIAKNEAEVNSLQKGLFALRGYTDAAIENRAALKQLQSTMVEMVEAYAAQGHSTQEVERYARQLKQEFIQQATQMGFNQQEVTELSGGFDSLTRAIRDTPRVVDIDTGDRGTVRQTQDRIDGIHGHPVTMPVTADTTPFYNAVNNAANYARATLAQSTTYGRTNLSSFRLGSGVYRPNRSSDFNRSHYPGLFAGGPIDGFASGGRLPGYRPANSKHDNLVGFAEGGKPVGLQSGEWVISQAAVKHYGDGFMKAVNERKLNLTPAAPEAPRVDMREVDLSPRSINAIGRAVSATVVLEGQHIAAASNRATSVYNTRGGF